MRHFIDFSFYFLAAKNPSFCFSVCLPCFVGLFYSGYPGKLVILLFESKLFFGKATYTHNLTHKCIKKDKEQCLQRYKLMKEPHRNFSIKHQIKIFLYREGAIYPMYGKGIKKKIILARYLSLT